MCPFNHSHHPPPPLYSKQSYPYAVASAVCAGFQYFVPGSRNLYDSNFKLQVYILVRSADPFLF